MGKFIEKFFQAGTMREEKRLDKKMESNKPYLFFPIISKIVNLVRMISIDLKL